LPLTWGADTDATEADWASLADTDFSEPDFDTEIEFDEGSSRMVLGLNRG
jgi:hypothetical protein